MSVNRYNRIIALLCIGLLLCACSAPGGAAALGGAQNPASATSGGGFVPRGYTDAVFHAQSATGANGVLMDASAMADGYVAVSATSEKRLKFQVAFGEQKYNYDLPGDGTPTVFPLQFGNGTYTLRVMENVTEDRYAELYAQAMDVTLTDEFGPFVRPSQMVNYTADAACVKQAQTMAAAADSEGAYMNAVYEFIKKTIAYDYSKADLVTSGEMSGYLPTPDETLQTKKGICFDYAALAAAMLRSQGIPTKVILGYVQDGTIYHAWNMIYLQDTGWVTVEINVPNNKWQPIDLTFAATGTDEALMGDAGGYVQRYVY